LFKQSGLSCKMKLFPVSSLWISWFCFLYFFSIVREFGSL